MIKILIAGGHGSGSALISLLREEQYSEIVGLYEKKHDAPGVLLAEKWDIPVFDDLSSALNTRPEIVINVTGDPLLSREIRDTYDGIEVIESAGTKLLWETVERQKRSHAQSLTTLEDQKQLYEFILRLQAIDDPNLIFETTLDMALTISGCHAGDIVLVEDKERRIPAHKGLSRRFINSQSKDILPTVFFEKIIKNGKILEVTDTTKESYLHDTPYLLEKIRSLLALPMKIEKDIKAILFLYDFKPRHFPLHIKTSLSLLVSITGNSLCYVNRILSGESEQRERDLQQQLTLKASELEEVNRNLESMVQSRTEQLRKMNDELERANQMKDSFIANMSHELRTPLNSIIGFSNVLLERTFGDLTENQQRYVENMHSSGLYLLELINDLLDIAKIESGKFEINLETFKLEDILNEVFNVMQPIIDKKGVDFNIKIQEGVRSITADRIKLKQILYNLISNAVKFSPEGGNAGIQVRKRLVNTAEYLQFSVWDKGIGIHQEDKDRIFDEFEQADSAFSKKYGGIGIGLALTKKLVQLHAGEIWVDSKFGEGSSFSFTIPLLSPVEKKVAEPLPETVSFDFSWVRDDAPLILVVENDVSTAELLTIHLTQSGYKVAHAYDGEEAIRKTREQKPFAITLDVMIPKKDGWEVLQELKSDPSTADIPVIIHSVIENKDLAFALGATDYLLKPLDKGALLKKLEDISEAKGKMSAPTTILLVGADEGEAENLKDMIGDKEMLFYSAPTGKRGMELAFALRPNLLILDFDLPDMQSFDFVKAMKESHITKDIPIFILSQTDLSVEDRMNLVGKIERIMNKHAFETKALIEHIKDLEILYPQKAGLIDEHTGLLNHRYFQLRLAQEVERATRYKLPLILVLVDIDDFGNYVKQKGMHYANSVLKKVSELLRKNIRGSDAIVRYGGDAFAVLLPNTVLSSGLSLSNRFNAIIKNYPFLHGEVQPRGMITVSVGLSFLDGDSPEELVLNAEKALKNTIEKGGDRVEVYEEGDKRSEND